MIKNFLSLNHRLHQLFATIENIIDPHHREEAKNLIIEKFRIITAEMKRRNFNVDDKTLLYRTVFKKDPVPKEIIDNFIKSIDDELLVVSGYVSLIGSSVECLFEAFS